MIKIKVDYNNDFIKGFKVTGHAGYDTYGKDIVCASVSSIVITSINLVISLDDKALSFKESEGLIDVKVLKEDEIINKVFNNMINMLKELQENYNKNIKFI